MVLLFVLATFPGDGPMLCISLWDLLELGLTVFGSRLTIILTMENGSVCFVLWERWRMKLISFFDVPSTMRLEGDSSIFLEHDFFSYYDHRCLALYIREATMLHDSMI